jgi:hypothetical protein
MFSILALRSRGGSAQTEAAGNVVDGVADDIEVILIDDSNMLHTSVGLDDHDPRSTLLASHRHAVGGAQGLAFNVAAETARGKYLSFVDGPDESLPDRWEAFRRAHRICGGFTWGFSGVEAVDERGRRLEPGLILDDDLRTAVSASTRPLDAIRELPHLFTPVRRGNVVVAAEAFRRLGGFRDFEHLSDWDLSLRLLRVGNPLTIERPLYRYRARRDGTPVDIGTTPEPAAVARERAQIVLDHKRGLAAERLIDDAAARTVNLAAGRLVDPETRAAIAAASWALDKLRRVPFAYGVARRVALTARGRRGRSR